MTQGKPKLLVVGLDGFDFEVASTLQARGRLPELARLRGEAHGFRLDPGIERYTGLAWEQFSSGLTPAEASRWSANTVDPGTYFPDQPTTRLSAFTEGLGVRTVAFDVPYFDLARAGDAAGAASWGAHDPGVAAHCHPAGLEKEIEERFGSYPAGPYVYGHVWPSAQRTSDMGGALARAVDVRTEVATWLLGERLDPWDLGMVVVAEYHSAVEGLWHGWDEAHPLHRLASAGPAKEGLQSVYEAGDRLLGRLRGRFPEVPLLVFGPHGMGTNLADVGAMLLLPELLYRHFTGQVGFEPDPAWALDGTGSPSLAEHDNWSDPVLDRLDIAATEPKRSWRSGFRRVWPPRPHHRSSPLDWMPAARYRAAWPGMDAFAIPAYYDARVRVNLRGRESFGTVTADRYSAVLDEVEGLLRACVDPATGQPLAVEFERGGGDPLGRASTDADLIVRFRKDHYAFEHSTLGLVGPVPCRRPGGHTGGNGVGWFRGRTEQSRELGTFPYLDIVGAVRAWLTGRAPSGSLGAALLEAESVDGEDLSLR